MARLGLFVMVALIMLGVVWGFHPAKMSIVARVGLGLAAIYALLSAVLPERILSQRINRREALPFNEIYRTSFQHLPYPRSLVEGTWNALARDFQLDASKLRPSDRIRKELSVKIFPLVDLSELLVSRLAERLRESESKANLAQLETIGECVEFLCRLDTERQQT